MTVALACIRVKSCMAHQNVLKTALLEKKIGVFFHPLMEQKFVIL